MLEQYPKICVYPPKISHVTLCVDVFNLHKWFYAINLTFSFFIPDFFYDLSTLLK